MQSSRIKFIKRGLPAMFSVVALLLVLQLNPLIARAQNSAFTFQGKLTDAGSSANGQYDLQFKLYDTATGGTLLGTLVRDDVQVAQGIFTVTLDYGTSFFLNDAGRYLEIGVRPGTSTGTFTSLAPRQEVTAAPYAVKSVVAQTATNSAQLGGVVASQYIVTTDARLSDARTPLAGSGNYIQNQTSSAQPADYVINGTGAANIFNAATQYNIGGFRALSSDGVTGNVFAGFNAGVLNTTGTTNSFFGVQAGRSNTTAADNSFFGANAGFSNSSGASNSFFGTEAGRSNTLGSYNSFFGARAGMKSTADFNSFFGGLAGTFNTSGTANSFFGASAGVSNTTGSNNSFFGLAAGDLNTTGFGNSYFGVSAGEQGTTQQFNSFFGMSAGRNNMADGNSFFGYESGRNNTSGQFNSFFGFSAGLSNTDGAGNSFFGDSAGLGNTSGYANSFFGNNAGTSNTLGAGNSFFGNGAGRVNTSGETNSFFGVNAGTQNVGGANNTFVGGSAGFSNTTGGFNTFVGANAGGIFDGAGSQNTLIGYNSHVGDGVTGSTAIGALAIVTRSNSIVLGGGANVGIGTAGPRTLLHISGGKIYLEANGQGVVLKSPSGACFELTVSNAGALTTTSITCP